MYKGNPHISSETLDEWLASIGELEAVEILTQKKLLAYKLQQAMKRKRMSKSKLATVMQTSRTVVDRLLNPNSVGVNVTTLLKASRALDVKLVDVT